MGSRNSKIPDQHELPSYDIYDETELGLSCKCQGILGFQLDFAERFSSSKEVGNHVSRTTGCKEKVAGLLRRFERAPHEGTANRKVLHPWSDVIAESLVHAGPKTIMLLR
jgi:hypothetical protein